MYVYLIEHAHRKSAYSRHLEVHKPPMWIEESCQRITHIESVRETLSDYKYLFAREFEASINDTSNAMLKSPSVFERYMEISNMYLNSYLVRNLLVSNLVYKSSRKAS